jgi:hypothetical protein
MTRTFIFRVFANLPTVVLTCWMQALELDPDDATLFANRSLCWLHIGIGGKPLLSLLDAYECKKRRPDWPKACYRQSKALMLLKVG